MHRVNWLLFLLLFLQYNFLFIWLMRRTSLHNREPVLIHWLAHSMCIQSPSQNPNTSHNATSNQMAHSVLFTPIWTFIPSLFREHIARFAPWEEKCSLESYYTWVSRRGVSDSTFNIKLLCPYKAVDRPRLDECNVPRLSNTWSGHITPLGAGLQIPLYIPVLLNSFILRSYLFPRTCLAELKNRPFEVRQTNAHVHAPPNFT